jgi:hypothetical protein
MDGQLFARAVPSKFAFGEGKQSGVQKSCISTSAFVRCWTICDNLYLKKYYRRPQSFCFLVEPFIIVLFSASCSMWLAAQQSHPLIKARADHEQDECNGSRFTTYELMILHQPLH